MKILFVTHIFPYPPQDGGRIGYYNPIKYLSRRHEIVLVSLVDDKEGANVEAMWPMCADIVTMNVNQSGRVRRAIRGVFSEPPGTASKYFMKPFGELLRATIARQNPDIVELQHLNMAAYISYCGGTPIILREHNAEYLVWERFAGQQASYIPRLVFQKLANRVQSYEADQVRRPAMCIAVSEADAAALRRISPAAEVTTIPSGVDCEYFTPGDDFENPHSMVMTGGFAWKPKQGNLRILLTHIFPLIRARLPQASLTIVGHGIPASLARIAEELGVTLTGRVPDVRPYVRQASLVLNYVEAGGGIALKVLEAMAMRKPVLSNDLGVEGISRIVAGVHAEVASSIEEFAAAATRLLEDRQRRNSLAAAGYALVRKHYAWDVLTESFDQVYRELAGSRNPRPLPA